MDNKVRADIMEHGFKVVRRLDGRLMSALYCHNAIEYPVRAAVRPPRKLNADGVPTELPASGPLTVFKDMDCAYVFMKYVQSRGVIQSDLLEIWSCRYVPWPKDGNECLWCYDDEGFRDTALSALPHGTRLAAEITLVTKMEACYE